MHIFHISDLHIGKQLNGYSLRKNQEKVLEQVAAAAKSEKPDVILICGDIYDKTVPSGEAYQMFDHFLESLGDIRPQIPVLIIAGNHDSPERLKFASSFLEKHKIYIAALPPQQPEERLKKIRLEDECGPVNFYMLPFVKPGMVRQLIQREKEEQGEEIQGEFGYQEAVEALLKREKIDLSERNVLLSHQFYTAGENRPETCDSELAAAAAGGLDEIHIKAVEMFDYVALGHLHGFQSVGRDYICYSGSPYKYSVSEERHKKGILSVKLGKKGEPVEKKRIPLSGLQDVRKEQGTLEEVLGRATEENRKDFVSITLTDEKETYNFRDKLEEVYEYILDIRIDNERIRKAIEGDSEELRTLTPLESFCEFYQAVRHMPISQEEAEVMEQVITGVERMGEDE